MSNRDTSIDSRLIESARKEFIEKGFIKAELKTICENATEQLGLFIKDIKEKKNCLEQLLKRL